MIFDRCSTAMQVIQRKGESSEKSLKSRESQLVRGEPLPPRASNDHSLSLSFYPSLFALYYLILQFVDEYVDEQRDLLFVRTQSISLKTGGRHVQGD